MSKKNHVPALKRRNVKGSTYQFASFRCGAKSIQRTYGKWGDRAGRKRFEMELAEWLANDRTLPLTRPDTAAPVATVAGEGSSGSSVAEVTGVAGVAGVAGNALAAVDGEPVALAELAEHYLRAMHVDHGAPWWRRNGPDLSRNVREFGEWCGPIDAAEVGPKRLKDFLAWVVTRPDPRKPDRARICVKTAREKRRCVVDLFRWAVSEELVPSGSYHALQAVKPIRTGRAGTRGSTERTPVERAHVDAVLPYLSTPVTGLVETMWHTGARPSELFGLCAGDIDRSGKAWRADLAEHKNAGKGKTRTLWFGPGAQTILQPLMLRAATRPLFPPSDAKRAAHKRADGRTARDNYDAQSFGRAIKRGIERCNKEREAEGLEPIPVWSPYQLRHSAASRLRAEHGIEAARVLLGHSSAITTEIYADVDATAAGAIAAKSC